MVQAVIDMNIHPLIAADAVQEQVQDSEAGGGVDNLPAMQRLVA